MSPKILNCIKSSFSVPKRFNATDAHYSVKIAFICFFSSSEIRKFYHLVGCHAIRINYSFNPFSSDLRFSNLICQVKRLAIFLPPYQFFPCNIFFLSFRFSPASSKELECGFTLKCMRDMIRTYSYCCYNC